MRNDFTKADNYPKVSLTGRSLPILRDAHSIVANRGDTEEEHQGQSGRLDSVLARNSKNSPLT